jgi:hypothetical protein
MRRSNEDGFVETGNNKWEGIPIQKRLDIINQWGDFLIECTLFSLILKVKIKNVN